MVRSSPRQPGSALKPFTYALAFEEGRTPATVLADVPSSFPTADPGVLYSPRNYDGRYRGPLLARRALAGSENVPAVALASEVGVSTLVRFLTRAGFTTFDRNGSYYGLGRHPRERRSAPRSARGGVCDVRARWRLDAADVRQEQARPRSSRHREPADGLLDHRHPHRRRRAILHLRSWRRPRVSLRGGRQDRDVSGLPRQLDRRLFPSRDGWRLGWQFRSVAAQGLDRRHRRRPDLPRGDARRRAPYRQSVQHRRDRRHADRRPSGCDLRALGHAREPVVPDAHDRVAAVGRRGSAVLVASPERRRPAHDLSAGISRLGGQERRSIRDGSSDAPDGGSNAAQRQLQPPH